MFIHQSISYITKCAQWTLRKGNFLKAKKKKKKILFYDNLQINQRYLFLAVVNHIPHLILWTYISTFLSFPVTVFTYSSFLFRILIKILFKKVLKLYFFLQGIHCTKYFYTCMCIYIFTMPLRSFALQRGLQNTKTT